MRRALEYQDRGIDLLLTGQSPLGEVPANPSAPLLDGIAACLLDVTDELRRGRPTQRDPDRWDTPAVDAFLGCAARHRRHTEDPRYRPHTITDDSRPPTAWHRWTRRTTEDPRWSTHLLDTTDQRVEQSANQAQQRVTQQRDTLRTGHLPLSRHRTDQTTTQTDHHS